MNKLIYLLLALVVIVITLLCLNGQTSRKPLMSESAKSVVEPELSKLETRHVDAVSDAVPVRTIQQPTNAIEPRVPLTNALTATNIEQWKTAIKGLHKSHGLSESWDLEQKNLTTSIPVTLQKNGKTVSYKAQFIDISIKNGNGDILEVQLHSPIMNIDDTKVLGLELCDMFGLDSADFVAWCDKVGNHWLDAPLFGSRDIHDQKSNAVFAFQILRGYNDEKPWFINLMIIPNP
jgi:hypothetical protein